MRRLIHIGKPPAGSLINLPPSSPPQPPGRRLRSFGTVVWVALLVLGVGAATLPLAATPAVAGAWHPLGGVAPDFGAHRLWQGLWPRFWPKPWRKPRPPHPPGLGAASGSECLIGGSAVAGGCVVTTQQPVLQIPGSGSGNVYIVDGAAPNPNNAWVSPLITLSPSSACGGATCYPVPPTAGLVPRQSYQWAFVPSGGSNTLNWQGFTIDLVRAGKEPTDSFGPLTLGLASGTVQTGVQTQPVQTASGTVQIGLAHRSGYPGTPTGEPWFVEDPAGALPVGWVFSGVDANVPWVRISGVGGSGPPPSAVTLQAFDGSLLEYTNTSGGTGGWAPPVGVGRPANDYGSLSQSADGSTFTWISGTSVVTFEETGSNSNVWLARVAQQILPGAGGLPSPGLQVSWDSAGRLASIADQSSLDSSGQATRVAHFYYGGDSQCGTPSDSGLVTAPTGLLCAFANLDGSRAEVYYRSLPTDFGAVQLGQVALPGGATWNFGWQTASYTLTNNTTVTAPQLLSVQTPSGHDAASAGTVATADSQWWVVYDPFFGGPQGLVSPLPGVGAAAHDRLGRYYVLGSGANPGQAQIAWGTVSGSAGQFSISPGAVLQQVGFDSAWRRTSVESFQNASLSYTATYSWDASIDQQTGVAFAGASQTQAYDFLGRPSTLTGPGTALSTAIYDQGNLAGWIATVYDNATLAAPGATATTINSAAVDWTSAPVGVSSETWSMQLSTYLAAPAAGANVLYRLTSDSHASATLWVNGQCTAASQVPASGCGTNNTAATSPASATGDALNLVVQYVRDGTAVSAAAPVSVQVEQQINGGDWTALALAALDPGLDLQSTVASSDTLAVGSAAVTLTQSTAWQDALFGTQAGVTYPGFGGALVTQPSYESTYNPTNSLWKRLIAQTSAGGSTYGLGYWGNTATPASPVCGNTAGVIQAGQVSTLIYPASASGQAAGLRRQLAYDAAGRKAGLAVIPAGDTTGVTGCLGYDARGRKLDGQLNAYSDSGSSTGGGGLGKAWAYSANGLTTTITHTFDAPPEPPACATESSAPYTCTETQTVDLLGRTVTTTDVWGTTVAIDYQLNPANGVQTTAATTTAGMFTTTTTGTSNRDGTPASLNRTDNAGSPPLSATWTYDSYGRAATIVTQAGGAEVITATYGYDDQNRVDALTWSRGGSTVATNALTLSPNSTRTLGEAFGIGGIDYDFLYTFNTAGWLTAAALTSNSPLRATWDFDFTTATLGTNANAHLNGNVTQRSSTMGSTSTSLALGYDFADRLVATTPDSTIAHDALGNLTQYGATQLAYDQADQLIEASDGAATVSFDRTPDGDLYRKVTQSNGMATAIRYAAGGLILDDSGNASSQTLVIGNLMAILDLSGAAANSYTVTTLQSGNALLTLDATGQPQNTASPAFYSPWGEALNGPVANPARPLYGWQATNLLESTAGLVLMGERTYLPALGRFTSLDPIFGGGINGYNYASNDPINNNDSNGTLSQSTKNNLEFGGIIGGLVVGTVVVSGGVAYGLSRATGPLVPNESGSFSSEPSASQSDAIMRSDSFDIVPEDDGIDFPVSRQSQMDLPQLTEGNESEDADLSFVDELGVDLAEDSLFFLF